MTLDELKLVLEQVEATRARRPTTRSGYYCIACGAPDHDTLACHKPGCRYARVRGILTREIEQEQRLQQIDDEWDAMENDYRDLED